MDLKDPGAALSLIFSEVKSGTLPKTILIEGKDEASRNQAARAVAASLVCENDDAPCLKCGQCEKALAGRHPDITVISPEEEKVSVDDIRKVRLDASISPFEAECKIVIFEKAQELNVQSQNALLKILEEPPQRVYFILTAPSSKLMLATVDSRCAKFSLGSLSKDDVYRSVCDFSEGVSQKDKMRLCNAVLYLDGFVPGEKSIKELCAALDIAAKFYTDGRFPFELLPSKKEESGVFQLILKVLSLCSLEILKAKKGTIQQDGGILGADAIERAIMRIPLKTAYSQYGFFRDLCERLDENANFASVVATFRAGIYE